MTQRRLLASLLVASTVIGGAAYAAEQAAGSSSTTSTAQNAADRDIGKLSADGAQAFRDMHMARVAIFDANPDQAKSLVGKAQAALGKAKTDETAFTKAEADLKKPATAANGKPSSDGKATPDEAKGAAQPGGDTTKSIAWLPVDGQLTLADDFVATPQKASAVSEANKTLAKGDQKGAVEKLKLAGVDVNFTMAVIPLDSTTTDVDQAAKLLEQGKYYEANAILKQAEDGLRLDVFDAAAIPQKAANAQPAKTGSHGAATDTTGSSGTPKSSTH